MCFLKVEQNESCGFIARGKKVNTADWPLKHFFIVMNQGSASFLKVFFLIFDLSVNQFLGVTSCKIYMLDQSKCGDGMLAQL